MQNLSKKANSINKFINRKINQNLPESGLDLWKTEKKRKKNSKKKMNESAQVFLSDKKRIKYI